MNYSPLTTEAEHFYSWWLHQHFLRISQWPPFERLVWLNTNAKGFGVSRPEMRQMYKVWAIDREFYCKRYEQVNRRDFFGGASNA